MDIKEALKITGFQLCEFKSEGEDFCNHCEKEMPEGSNVYYQRTCYESDEGEYYCEDCTIKMPEYWKEDAEDLEKYLKEKGEWIS